MSIRRLFSLVLLGGIASCSPDGSPVGPAQDREFGIDGPSLGSSGNWGRPSQPGSALTQQLQLEQQRIQREAVRMRSVYDSLIAGWIVFFRNNPGFRLSDFALLTCAPLPYSGAAAIVGPSGGQIKFGPHTLTIPRGALTTSTVITAESPPANIVSVTFSPHGLSFLVPPELELSYRHCVVPKNHVYRLVYIDDADNVVETPLSVDQKRSSSVIGWIWHFSKYAVAY